MDHRCRGKRWTIDVGGRWTIDVGERWTIDGGEMDHICRGEMDHRCRGEMDHRCKAHLTQCTSDTLHVPCYLQQWKWFNCTAECIGNDRDLPPSLPCRGWAKMKVSPPILLMDMLC